MRKVFGVKKNKEPPPSLQDATERINKRATSFVNGDVTNTQAKANDMQDEMMNLMDISSEIQESLGRSYSVPDDIDEDELMGELDALEADMGSETATDGIPAYLQPDKEPDLDSELNLPSAPSGHGSETAQANPQAADEFGLPAVPRASLRS